MCGLKLIIPMLSDTLWKEWEIINKEAKHGKEEDQKYTRVRKPL